MKFNLLFIGLIVFVLGSVLSMESCYYDNEEYLYGESNCDSTTTFTYQNKVKALMDSRCATSGCHGGSSPANGVDLSNYNNVKSGFQNLSMMCNIRHESGCIPMPKNEGQLSRCEIRALERWQENGYPEN